MELSRLIPYGLAIALIAGLLGIAPLLRALGVSITLQVIGGAIAFILVILAISSLYASTQSARRKAETSLQRLQASEARYRRLLETAYEGIWVIDTNCKTEYVNPRMAEILGYRIEEIIECSLFEFMDEAARQDLQQEMKRHPAGIRGQYDLRFQHKDGSDVWTITSANPILSDEGCFRGTLAMVTDVSDRKQAEAKIQQINDQLEQRVKQRTAQLETANRELEAFSYSVSHDLRAPLRHISGFASLLKNQAGSTLDPVSQRYLNIITETTTRAGIMVDDLLSFSRMGRAEIQHATVNLNELIQDVRRDLEPETTAREIRWKIHPMPTVQGDAALLRQVIYNLIENAVKYTQGHTQAEIEIGSIGNEQEETIFIRDNGLGFDMRYAHKLFGVFQRLHSEPQIQGTGIGLANVRRIIHRHGGQTWAEGELGKGATFYFSLPVLPQRASENERKP
jgi:PAS domain S-box-containing protein